MRHFLQTVAMKSVITLVIITDNFMKVVTVTESNSHLNDIRTLPFLEFLAAKTQLYKS